MSDLSHREKIELQFKAELDEAEQKLRHATLKEKPEAHRRFREALHNFTGLVLDGKLPPESRCA